jgi:hypothetical protein
VRWNYLSVALKHQALLDIASASLLFDVALLHRDDAPMKTLARH